MNMLVFPIFKYMIKQDIVNIMDNGKNMYLLCI